MNFRNPLLGGGIVPKILIGLVVIVFIKLQWSSSTLAVQNSYNHHFGSKIDYEKTFISHGPSKCFPEFGDDLKAAALERNRTCAQYAPFPAEETHRVAFASISTGETGEVYERAIQSVMFASAVKGSQTHILCDELSDGAWNKIAYLLKLTMDEMLKPVEERLEWIMWIDRDAILLDPCRPLSSFLPPNTSDFEDVNLIYNTDGIGLNAGVFIFKVGQWAIDLFGTILAFRYYRPGVKLGLAEQTAMDKIIHEAKWNSSTAHVPWYWFNAYPNGAPHDPENVKKYREGLEPEGHHWYRARKGDYVVHFAGNKDREDTMLKWEDMLQEVGNIYQDGEWQRDITQEAAKYWEGWRENSLTDEQMSGTKWKQLWYESSRGTKDQTTTTTTDQ